MRSIRNLKNRVYGLEARAASEVALGLASGLGKGPIMRSLRGLMASFVRTVRVSRSEADEIWGALLAIYSGAARSVRGSRTDPRRVYLAMRSLLPGMESFRSRFAMRAEERDKRAYIADVSSSGIFFLCTSHERCAEGHEPYQGKVFVSSEWRSRCSGKKERRRVAAWIREHGCLTVEEAVSGPIWLITRPNCRHRLIPIPTDEALGSTEEGILRSHPEAEVGAPRRDPYRYGMYRMYYERLRLLDGLRKACPCDELERDARKTRALMKKWLSESIR